jgi:hypothetical protein
VRGRVSGYSSSKQIRPSSLTPFFFIWDQLWSTSSCSCGCAAGWWSVDYVASTKSCYRCTQRWRLRRGSKVFEESAEEERASKQGTSLYSLTKGSGRGR